jgi:hypothetical protein
MATKKPVRINESPAERAVRLQRQLEQKLVRVERRARRLTVAESLSDNKTHESLQQKLRDNRAHLHRTRIEIARKRTSIKAHLRKIAEREAAIAKLLEVERIGVMEQEQIEAQITTLEKQALKQAQS